MTKISQPLNLTLLLDTLPLAPFIICFCKFFGSF